ncbi:unnamed protein product, partial [Symbiodinium sp. KB8]
MPEPQVTLTPASAPRPSVALPLDLRNFGFSILTFEAEPGQSVADVFTALQTARNGRRSLFSTGLDPSDFDFQDARSFITATLQDPVSQHEWVRIVQKQATSEPVRVTTELPVGPGGCFEVASGHPVPRPTTSTTTSLESCLFSRPVRIPDLLEQVEVLPSGVLAAPGAHLPVSRLGIFTLNVRGSARCVPFLLLVRGFTPVRLEGAETWTLLDFCSCAADNAECRPRRVQVLTSPMPDLLQPQVVVTEHTVDLHLTLLPIDLRAMPGGDVMPLLLREGMTTADIIAVIVEELPATKNFLEGAFAEGRVHFQDAEGFVLDSLPRHLHAMQWLALRCTHSPFGRGTGSTSTTTTPFYVPVPELQLSRASCTSRGTHEVCCAASPAFVQEDLGGQLVAPVAVLPGIDDSHQLHKEITSSHGPDLREPELLRVSLIEVQASSQAPLWYRPVKVPPEGPPPDPDRDPRTPPVSARGPSSSRPSNADMLRAAQLRILPAEVADAAVYMAPVGAFSWSGIEQGPHTGVFSVFDARRHHTVDRAHAWATLQEVVALAVAHAPFQVAAVQILTQTVRGLPKPQLVLQEAGRPPQEFPLVWDLRGIQEPVLTCRHFPRELRDDALLRLQMLPGFFRDLKVELSRGTLALFDCLGALPAQFPSDLFAMQHIQATALTGPSVPASSHTGPARLTGVPDVVGRGNRPRIGPVRQHPPGLRLTVLRGHHRFSVDCTYDNGAIDTLVFDLLVQHHTQAALPTNFLLVLGGAQPLRMGYYQEVVFVVQDGTQVATVWDGRHLGQELQVNLHPPSQSTCQVLDADWTANGWRLFINGVPEAAAMRHIRTGDYLQPCSGAQCPGVVPLGSLLTLCPALRPFAWPLEVSITGTGFSASLRKRRKQLGGHRMPEGTARVYGPHHGEIFVQIGTGHTPTALQVDTVLQNLDGFPEGLNVLGTPTRHPHDADFVTRYRFRQDSTVLTPAPGHAGHLLVMLVHADTEVLPGVPANPRIMLYPQRGLRHGDVLQQIPEPHFVFGEDSEEEPAASDPAGPPPPEPMSASSEGPILVFESGDEHPSEGTNLLQVRATKQRVVHAPSAAALPTDSRSGFEVVATPFGRRRLGVCLMGHRTSAVGSTHEPGDRTDKVKIVLSDCIPATSFSAEVRLHFPVPAGLPDMVFEGFRLEAFQTVLPLRTTLHAAAADLLAHLPVWSKGSSPSALMPYVDGSFKKGKAAWAVTGFALDAKAWSWAGFLGSALDDRFEATSAYEAELMAQFAAHCVAAQSPCPVAIFYDSTAAAAATEGRTSLKAPSVLGKAVASVSAFLQAAGRPPWTCHVASHTGNPANELVDSLAKRFLCVTDNSYTDVMQPLVDSILAGDLEWLWVRANTQVPMPAIDEHGDTLPVCAVEESSKRSTPAAFAPPSVDETPRVVRCPLRLVTYNVLSAKSALQRQCLHRAFKHGNFSVIALQETKFTEAPHRLYDGVLRLAGPCSNGEEGVALWFNVASPDLPWRQAHIATTFANERLLSAMVSLPGLKLMFFSGHARPGTAPHAKIDSFWELVRCRLRALPPNTAPVLLMDANARFQESDRGLNPANRNAEHWLRLLEEFSLQHTGVRNLQGELMCTWTSPCGQPACLDYIAFPALWSTDVKGVDTFEILDEFAGVDHSPLYAMHTAQGKHTIDGIMARLPRIPWEVDVDDHVCQLNSFFQGQLAVHFAAKRQRPRHPALSDRTWKLLSTKRHLRRSQRFRFAAVSKRRLSELFVAWKGCCWAGPALNFDHMHARLKADDLQASLFVFAMRRLQVQIRASFREDIAVFTRAMWKDARGGGPAEMARLLRSVLKAGRSYKPPRAAVALNCNGHTVTDPKDVATTFGRMFAVAEQAREVDFSELQGCPGAAVSERPTCMVEHLPSVATVAASFASLKPRRAAGLSRIPPDFYAAAPLRSALAHIPVLLKMLARRRAPVLWGGCLSRPLLKPHKAPDDPKSYRAIALQEPAAKAVSKALRPHLCDCFEQVALQGIGGARPAFALTVPALTVQASLSFAREAKRSIGVLFIDGVAAFYATSREALFRQDRAELEHRLRSGPHAGEVVEAFLSYLPSEGALAAAGVDTAAVDFLQVAMSNTWYSTFPSAPEVYQTSKGTIPGAPLADILFQYVLQAAVLTLDFLLRRSGLALSVQHGGHSVHAQPCSWLDDLTLLVQADDPASLADAVSQAAILAHRCLSLIGIEVNYAPNKTEALLQWRGKGSQAAKERVLVNNAGLIDLGEISGTRLQLRCTDEYTHLGSVRASSATASADLSRRAALARTLYQPLRARLLRNVELSVKERSHLLFSTVIASFTHGLGTWTLARHGEWKQFRGEYMKFLRGAVRPILAVPCRRLDASQVCALLGALTPEEAFVVCRVRAFSQLVAKGSDFVKSVLVLERTWLSSVREAILQLQAALRLTALAAFKELPLHGFWEVWPYDSKATSRLLKNYSKVRIRSREGLFQPALAKAQLHHKLDSLECTFIKLGPVEAGARQVACAECGQIFSTPASCAAHRCVAANFGRQPNCAITYAVDPPVPICALDCQATFDRHDFLIFGPSATIEIV